MLLETDLPDDAEYTVPKERSLQYPYEYFHSQVSFAVAWAHLSGESLEQTLLEKTALYVKLTDAKLKTPDDLDPRWQEFVSIIQNEDSADTITSSYFFLYQNQPQSEYQDPISPENDGKHFGFFGFDYYPHNAMNEGKNTIKVHFFNPVPRGDKSGLHAEFSADRQKDLKRMFEFIKQQHPEAEEVVGGSWLYNLPSYRLSFPTAFTENMYRLVPPGFDYMAFPSRGNLTFSGDSVWGQFLNRNGGVRAETYATFLENVHSAETIEDLLNAFPNFTWQPRAPIDVFYKEFQII